MAPRRDAVGHREPRPTTAPPPPGVAAVVVRRLVELYQRGVSPWLPFRCRFHPSCSRYFLEALERFGLARAMWLGLRRLLRCQPFCAGGYDPVPEKPVRDPRPPGQAT